MTINSWPEAAVYCTAILMVGVWVLAFMLICYHDHYMKQGYRK